VTKHPDVDLIFLDIKMPGRDGLDVLGDILKIKPDAAVVVISGHATFETAVEATKRGAFDFVEKPLDRELVLLKVRKARDFERLSRENVSLRTRLSDVDSRMLGDSAPMRSLREVIAKVAPTPARVLIQGENGSGKELVARLVHETSGRANGPFVAVNCGAIPKELIESTLFGHEKGAFTGAVDRQKGKFEQADGGTLFLDEVGDMPLEAQTKVLRVLEDSFLQRVGGGGVQIKVDVRVVTATNKDLRQAVEQGQFREDLYYRLNIIPLILPPLRERKDDIPLLSEHFIRKICHDLGIETKRLEPGVLDLFLRYNWPGNVRELEATLHRAIVMSNDDTVTRNDFYGLFAEMVPVAADEGAVPMPSTILNPMIGKMEITSEVYDEVIATVDKQLIVRALETSGGRIREAARRLGLARNTLKAKIQKYNISARD